MYISPLLIKCGACFVFRHHSTYNVQRPEIFICYMTKKITSFSNQTNRNRKYMWNIPGTQHSRVVPISVQNCKNLRKTCTPNCSCFDVMVKKRRYWFFFLILMSLSQIDFIKLKQNYNNISVIYTLTDCCLPIKVLTVLGIKETFLHFLEAYFSVSLCWTFESFPN